MLAQISWMTFFESLIILLIIYYAIVLTLFYRKDILLRLNKGAKYTPETLHGDLSSIRQKQPVLPEQIQHLMDEIGALIQQAGYSRFTETETKDSMQKLISLDRFQSVKQSAYLDPINEMITNECKMNCSMHLNEEDLQRLWMVQHD